MNGLGSILCVATSFQAERRRTPHDRMRLVNLWNFHFHFYYHDKPHFSITVFFIILLIEGKSLHRFIPISVIFNFTSKMWNFHALKFSCNKVFISLLKIFNPFILDRKAHKGWCWYVDSGADFRQISTRYCGGLRLSRVFTGNSIFNINVINYTLCWILYSKLTNLCIWYYWAFN